MANSTDQIVQIPETMHKYFGGGGEMVKRTSATIESLVETVPEGMLITLDSLREHLAEKHGVRTACPAATMRALVEASKANSELCSWRVVKKNGELLPKLPNGLDGQAQLLMKEGLEIDRSKKAPSVARFADRLHNLH